MDLGAALGPHGRDIGGPQECIVVVPLVSREAKPFPWSKTRAHPRYFLAGTPLKGNLKETDAPLAMNFNSGPFGGHHLGGIYVHNHFRGGFPQNS